MLTQASEAAPAAPTQDTAHALISPSTRQHAVEAAEEGQEPWKSKRITSLQEDLGTVRRGYLQKEREAYSLKCQLERAAAKVRNQGLLMFVELKIKVL